ncbi:MAG TPA: nicotinamide riboside transporter PnuC, partial [Candidatus Eisenbacteria bacterium]
MSPLELAGVATGLVGVWLITRENVWCWIAMILSASLYTVVFYEARLYAGMGLQVVYVLMFLYGWWGWLHGGPGGSVLRVSRTPAPWRMALLAGAAAGTAVLGMALARHTDESLPYWDSAATSMSLAAQWMQTRKWLENWLVWIAVDLVYVGMCLYRGLLPTVGLYATLLVLAAIGLIQWKRSMAVPAG